MNHIDKELCMLKLLLALCVTLLSGCSLVSFQEENDIFGLQKTDNMYTQGLLLKYFESADNAPSVMKDSMGLVPSLSITNELSPNRYSFEIGQQMYTPSSKRTSEPVYDQNPYAGLLYAKAMKEDINLEERQWSGLIIGTTGPHSFAGDTQRWFHGILGQNKPNGWGNQVDNEIVFMHQSGLEDRDVLFKFYNAKVEQTSGYNLNLGTWNTSLELFIAHHIGQNYELFSKSDRSWSWRVFNKPYAKLVGRDMTLDGNTFHDSKVTVDKIPFVYGDRIGVVFEYSGYALELGITAQSKIYSEQKEYWHFWGGWTVTKLFDLY